MAWGIECLEDSSAKVESLTVLDMMDRALVIAEHAFVCSIHPKFVETACRSDMVSMTVGEKEAYRLVCYFCDDLVKLRDMCAGIEQDGFLISFNDIYCL